MFFISSADICFISIINKLYLIRQVPPSEEETQFKAELCQTPAAGPCGSGQLLAVNEHQTIGCIHVHQETLYSLFLFCYLM